MLQADIAFQSPRVENHDEEKSSKAKELRLIAPKNTALTPALAWLNIWKACVGTITAMSRTDSSMSMIWFCEESRRQKAYIS
jgi:hypothetical protein